MHCIVLAGSPLSGLRIECHCFFWILCSFLILMLKFQKFSQPVQQVLHVQPCFINVLPCFSWLSLIRARNWVSFVFLDSLFSEESFAKVSDFFSIGWTSWEPVQQGGLVAAPFYKLFTLFQPVLPRPGSEFSAVCFVGFHILWGIF